MTETTTQINFWTKLKMFVTNSDIFEEIPVDDLIARQRFILFRIFTLAGMAICIAVAIQAFVVLQVEGFIHSFLFILAGIFAFNYVMFRYHKQRKFAYGVIVYSAFFVIHLLTYDSGGIRNSGMLYLGSIMLTTFMLLGNRAGKIFSLIAFIHLIYFYYITENTNWVSNILVGDGKEMIDLDFLVTGLLSLFLIAVQINSLEGSKNIVIQKVNQSRRELHEKNIELEKLSLVASKTDNAVVITDFNGVTEWVNEGFTRLTGFSHNAIVGNKSADLLYGPLTDRSTLVDMHNTIANGRPYTGELLKYHKDGHIIWMHMTVTPITKNDGTISKYIFIESDITAKKQSEEKMAEYMLNLEKTNKELDQFAYIVSHDLKAPLRAIGNLSCWIEEDMADKFSDDTKENFNLIKGRVTRMESLINGILDYSKISRKQSEKQNVSVSQLITETVDFIGSKNIVELEIANELPVLFTDKTKLQQVFTNLISNAINYNDKEKLLLNIKCEELEESWKFSIRDNGPGIEQQYHEKIFVIFQTLQSRDVLESTGVGLAIVKKIIDEQGGKIWVESELNKGATFHFLWPKNTSTIWEDIVWQNQKSA